MQPLDASAGDSPTFLFFLSRRGLTLLNILHATSTDYSSIMTTTAPPESDKIQQKLREAVLPQPTKRNVFFTPEVTSYFIGG